MSNILFITIGRFAADYEKEIYPDLIYTLESIGHKITVLRISSDKDMQTKVGNITIVNRKLMGIRGNTSAIKKGVAYLKFPAKCISFIKTMGRIDLCIAATPPVTLSYVFRYFNKRGVQTYLLQKDIFPEDAVDLGVLKKEGILGVVYKFFRKCENKLYMYSNRIGAMSESCVNYLVEHNKNIPPQKFEINPNSIIPRKVPVSETTIIANRNRFGLPLNKVVFIYGGNISDAQGPDYIELVLENLEKYRGKAYFLFIGEGEHLYLLKDKFREKDYLDFRSGLNSSEYYELVSACDVGLVFLSDKLHVPNIPSRILFYMDNGLPILGAIDTVSDFYDTVNGYKLGVCTYSKAEKLDEFLRGVEFLLDEKNRRICGNNAKEFMVKNWSSSVSVHIIQRLLDNGEG